MELVSRVSNEQSILRYRSEINLARTIYDFARSHPAEFLLLSVSEGESFEVHGEDGHRLKRGDMVALNRNEVVSVRVRDSHFRGNLRVSAQGALECLGTSFAPNSQYVIQASWGEIVRSRFLRLDELIPPPADQASVYGGIIEVGESRFTWQLLAADQMFATSGGPRDAASRLQAQLATALHGVVSQVAPALTNPIARSRNPAALLQMSSSRCDGMSSSGCDRVVQVAPLRETTWWSSSTPALSMSD